MLIDPRKPKLDLLDAFETAVLFHMLDFWGKYDIGMELQMMTREDNHASTDEIEEKVFLLAMKDKEVFRTFRELVINKHRKNYEQWYRSEDK